MRLFLAIHSHELLDQVKVGLAAFGDIVVDEELGVLALEKIRQSEIDGLIVALDPAVPEHESLIEQVRRDMPQLDVIVIGHESAIAKLKADKVRGRVFALQRLPLEPVDFFRTIRRLRERRASPARAR
ncbi:MAG: hypothetical protein EXS13_01790 [Planctomycetes bacterium]|nr:hypothetical protein [Planctomycetota bacterium]